MTIEDAKALIGQPVFTTCAGYKLVRSLTWHGPYELLQVTKAGRCILKGREEFRPTLTQISPLAPI